MAERERGYTESPRRNQRRDDEQSSSQRRGNNTGSGIRRESQSNQDEYDQWASDIGPNRGYYAGRDEDEFDRPGGYGRGSGHYGSTGGRNRSVEDGGYRGMGPKDYNRSEQRIREDVCDRLTDDDRIDARNISIEVGQGEVRLRGTVRNRDEKRRAERCCEDISGVSDVINELRVRSGSDRSGDSDPDFDADQDENRPTAH